MKIKLNKYPVRKNFFTVFEFTRTFFFFAFGLCGACSYKYGSIGALGMSVLFLILGLLLLFNEYGAFEK